MKNAEKTRIIGRVLARTINAEELSLIQGAGTRWSTACGPTNGDDTTDIPPSKRGS